MARCLHGLQLSQVNLEGCLALSTDESAAIPESIDDHLAGPFEEKGVALPSIQRADKSVHLEFSREK